MQGKLLFTTKDYFLASREVFPTMYAPGIKKLNVSDVCAEGFYGFGVAITPSSCYELNLMEASARKKLLKHIYGKDGLGLSVARLCIGSSDYSAEMYSYDDVDNDVELKHFSVERDEKYVIPMIKEILKINPDLFIFASPWSPPYWMKVGGHMCGGYMRDAFVDCYADYIIKFIEAYAKHGIKVSAITPQNEAKTDHGGRMPACLWHPETEAKFIRSLRKKLIDKGLDVKIWMHDHNFWDTDKVIWLLENCEGLSQDCDGVAFHYYEGDVEQTAPVTEKFPHLELHFTEGGPRLTDNYDTDWCKWGLMAIKSLKTGYRSFTGWNLMLDELGGPNIGPFISTCGGFVTRDSRTEELRYSGQYKAFSHISPYILPSSKIRYIRGEGYPVIHQYPKREFDIEGILIENPDGRTVAVVVNPNERAFQTQLEINGSLWYLELPADSISTVIVE